MAGRSPSHRGLAVLAFAVAALAAAARSVPARQAGPEEILERAARRYSTLSAICAEFSQRMRIELLKQEQASRGRLCHQRPARFAMRFTQPPGDAIIADGEFVWIYYPSVDAGQVIRSRATDATGGVDFQREFLEDPTGKYVVQGGGEETVGGRRTHLLRLVPRAPSPYRGVSVWIDGEASLVRRLEIQEENGTIRRLDFRRIELNPRLAPDFFRFVPPPGARIIER
ncbi:MAG: outer membrane lipoprotein carrier protein LolA [Gemmatimonadetes bacterium]|nr:outer membrane lipoprotein carrier protein LolA [Gemmatimonadota bacterium]